MAYSGLRGRVAIVTGAAGGIGAATCRRLAEEGCFVGAIDRETEGLRRLAAELSEACLPIEADVSKEEDCDRYVQATQDHFGALNLFVNNAGVIGKRTPVAETSIAEFERVYAVNVRGAFLGMRAALRAMLAQGSGGSIVNVSSVGGLRSQPLSWIYGSSKRALIGLANSAAAENGRHKIRVNTICPGPVDTSMLQPAVGEGVNIADRVSFLPLGRAADPAEIASFIAFLLSDDASFQTAGVYTIDGGMSH